MNGYQWSMDQDLEPSPTALHGHPVVCSEPPPVNRDEPFKQLLLTLARKMDRNNSSELAYAAGCNLPETAPPALEVLRELEKQGSFSARCCSNLENLLRRIERCDLAELVVKHMESFPDLPQAKRLHSSMQEKGSSLPTTPFKRSATDPPSTFRHHQQQIALAQSTAGVGLAANALVDDFSEGLHMSNDPEAATLISSTPKHDTYAAVNELLDMLSTPIAHIQPQTSYVNSTTETTPVSVQQQNNQSGSAHSNSSREQYHSSYGSVPSNPNSRDGRDLHHRKPSRSADVSRQGSVHSLCSSQSRCSLNYKASQMAHIAIDIMAHVSGDQLSDTYNSNSTSSISSAVRHTQSETASMYSDHETAHVNAWKKKQSHSFHGVHSTHLPMRRSPSVPTRNRSYMHRSAIYPIPATEDIEAQYDASQSDLGSKVSNEDLSEDEPPSIITRRRKSNHKVSSEQFEFQSLLSDATPRQSVAIDKRQSTISDATLKRQSVISDGRYSAASEATSEHVTSPRSPSYLHNNIVTAVVQEDVAEVSTDGGDFPKFSQREKSRLRRSISLLRRNPRATSTPHFTWKIGREELMKRVWQDRSLKPIARKERLVLEINPGKHNPEVSFLLYPYGIFQDENNAVTMAVRITTSTKCPPLPPSAELRLSLSVWGVEGNQRNEVNQFQSFREKLSTSMFYIYAIITHDQLKQSKCKYFHLDIEIWKTEQQRLIDIVHPQSHRTVLPGSDYLTLYQEPQAVVKAVMSMVKDWRGHAKIAQ